LMVLCHKLIMRSERFSAMRCIMSEPAELGSPSMENWSTPEKIEGLDIPVAKHLAHYWLSFGEETSLHRFLVYVSCDGTGRLLTLMSEWEQPSTL
jgi:hypothetical protein